MMNGVCPRYFPRSGAQSREARDLESVHGSSPPRLSLTDKHCARPLHRKHDTLEIDVKREHK